MSLHDEWQDSQKQPYTFMLTSYAMQDACTLVGRQRKVGVLSDDLDDFVNSELNRNGSLLAAEGWTVKTLLALFKADMPFNN